MPQLEVQRVRKSDDRTLPIFAELDQLADQIRMEAYNLFRDRGAGEGHALDDWLAAERQICWPSAELAEADDEYRVKIALAGFEPREIAVTATPREIIVKAEHDRETKTGEQEARWSEFGSSTAFRRISLPAPVEVDKISASLKNGLLEIAAPKARAASQPAKTINVSAAASA